MKRRDEKKKWDRRRLGQNINLKSKSRILPSSGFWVSLFFNFGVTMSMSRVVDANKSAERKI